MNNPQPTVIWSAFSDSTEKSSWICREV